MLEKILNKIDFDINRKYMIYVEDKLRKCVSGEVNIPITIQIDGYEIDNNTVEIYLIKSSLFTHNVTRGKQYEVNVYAHDTVENEKDVHRVIFTAVECEVINETVIN